MATDGGGSSIGFPDVPKLELDQLIDQLVVNAQSVRRAQGRLRALLRAIETVTGDLTLETVLHNIVEAARQLASAQYCALGVISHDRTLEQFIYVGIDGQTAADIGNLPRGRGLLGALITDAKPIRLRDISEDQRSSGFPPNHPPMDSFLGVPVSARGEVFGNIYLTNSANGEFSTEDEELVIALAQAAGTAISNARLYQEAQLKQRWLEASAEITAAMLATAGEDPLQLIARRALDLADADAVSVSLLSVDRRNLVVEVAFGGVAEQLVGRRYAADTTLGGQVALSGRPALVVDSSSGDTAASLFSPVMDAGPVMVLPLSGTGRPRGALSLVRIAGRRPFSPADLEMAAGFAGQASVALELADTRAAEQKLVLLEDRDRIARDLHDHVIQELFSIGLSLEGAAGQLPEGKVTERVQRAIENIDRTIRRIRTSIFQLRGNFVNNEGGLRQRILEVVSELATPLGFVPHTAFAGLIDEAFDETFIEDVLACVRESLPKVAQHAHAPSAWVDVVAADDELTVTVSDNGAGPGDGTRSSGTANLRARAERRRGSLEIGPGPSGGTLVTWKARTG
jgi:signal transduction histidine kinase